VREKRRCRMHGGKSTGPRTPDGRRRSQRARWRHGGYSAAERERIRQFNTEARALCAANAARVAAAFAGMKALIRAQFGNVAISGAGSDGKPREYVPAIASNMRINWLRPFLGFPTTTDSCQVFRISCRC
jgi:hypothetical protein